MAVLAPSALTVEALTETALLEGQFVLNKGTGRSPLHELIPGSGVAVASPELLELTLEVTGPLSLPRPSVETCRLALRRWGIRQVLAGRS